MLRLLRPLWPQIASKFSVRYQVRVGQIGLISLKPVRVYTLIVISALKIVHILNSYKIAVR